MTHGDPVGRSNSRTGQGGNGSGGAGNGSNGRQTPIMDSDCEDSSANTPMSAKMGKLMSVKVLMLDDSITVFQVQSKAPGRILFDQACKQLSLLEIDYFGLEYQDGHGVTYWMDVEKQLNHQVGLSTYEPLLKFCVKFYTPDPSLIEEEYTRYLFGLQIKRDLAMGQLQCNDNTAALMASYIVQAECGDYVIEDYPDHTYLSSYKFVPHQDHELERKIMENHKKHIGQSPAEADLNLLETARRCELYGVKMHASKDHEGVPLNLAVAHMGALVFQNFTKINTFSWAKIRKLSFKRKKYLIKLHPEGYGYYKDTVEFYFDDRNQCKNFWKKCVEHHSFFRCSSSLAGEREKHRLLSRGSSFRYSGKTQKQMQEFVRENYVKRQSFQRNAARTHSSMVNVGQSISAQPLLPIGDTSLESPINGERNINKTSPSSKAASEVEPLSPLGSPLAPPTSAAVAAGTTAAAPSSGNSVVQPLDTSPYQSVFANSLSNGNNRNIVAALQQQQQYRDASMLSSPTTTSKMEDLMSSEPQTTSALGSASVLASNGSGGAGGKQPKMASAIPPSPLKILREDSVDGTLSPVSSKSTGTDTDTDTRKKRYPTDRAYFIAKEILMTERTYKKDLEILNLWFRDEVSKEEQMPEELLSLLFSHLDPIYELHCSFLKDIEQRMATWEGRGNAHLTGNYKRIGDVVLHNFDSVTTEYYLRYVDTHGLLLEKLERVLCDPNSGHGNFRFGQVFRDFESQKVCYLPLTTLILKPLHRILHYELLLERLLKHYNTNHPDYQSTNTAMVKIQSVIRKMSVKLRESENFVKLAELQRDLGGYEHLLQPEREFLREGCLQKLSRKGYQQRMFFLFSDLLIYANRTTTPSLHFRVHGQMMLKDVTVLDSEPRLGQEHCFNLYDGKKAVLVAATSHAEKLSWMEDIAEAAQIARDRVGVGDDLAMPKFTSLKSIHGSEDGLDRSTLDKNTTLEIGAGGGQSISQQQRTNSSVHVCWHRSTTVPVAEYHRSLRNLLSGYLLRKFKSSNGWQKLWVIFTNSCLFFFKTFEDDCPLASLPLLGYSVRQPDACDAISKDYVFKLVFKNHVYFFRAESQYTFERWIEVLGTATRLSNDLMVGNQAAISDHH